MKKKTEKKKEISFIQEANEYLEKQKNVSFEEDVKIDAANIEAEAAAMPTLVATALLWEAKFENETINAKNNLEAVCAENYFICRDEITAKKK